MRLLPILTYALMTGFAQAQEPVRLGVFGMVDSIAPLVVAGRQIVMDDDVRIISILGQQEAIAAGDTLAIVVRPSGQGLIAERIFEIYPAVGPVREVTGDTAKIMGSSVHIPPNADIKVGQGFGVPLILRYVLQICETAEEAAEVLARVPTDMSYNVTVLDKKRNYLTVMMAPDRPAVITQRAVATNHQETVEWISHARFTATVERERFLQQRLRLHQDPEEKFINLFLRPPLYSSAFRQGFGTLYTAVYRPRKKEMELRWPGVVWPLSLKDFVEGAREVVLPGVE